MTSHIIDLTFNLWNRGRKIKKSASGWLSGNAVCCSYNGQSVDTRGRGGIIVELDNKINYSCFNCGFKASYVVGSSLGVKFKKLLGWLGADESTINQLTIEALKSKDAYEGIVHLLPPKEVKIRQFEYRKLPENSRLLNPKTDVIHTQFLKQRGIDYRSYNFYVVDNESRTRIIIPYYHGGKLVGSTSRYYDNLRPKYIADRQTGYVFNIDRQKSDWMACILVEGEFDAISVDGCAYMGNNISDEQAEVLNTLGRKIIVVPDRDHTGLKICDRALELGYHVSIPSWSSDIKDVNDAVKKYGKLSTLLSIIQGATNNKILIKMKRNKLS
jgi:hypothetical protein